MSTKDAINQAIDMLDGPVQAARRLGVERYQTVQQWAASGRVPAKYCPRIERETKGRVRCEDLCPDVDWAYLRNSRANHQEAA